MKHYLKQRVLYFIQSVFPWLCIFIALYSLFFNTVQIKQIYSSSSLRYRNEITYQQAKDTKKYALENSQTQPYWPIFWKEEKSEFKSILKTISANNIIVDGQADLVFPVAFTQGGYPPITGNFCAVSEQLAWELYGSTNVTGTTVFLQGNEYIISGVFKGKTTQAITSVSPFQKQNWHNIELSGTPFGDEKMAAENFALGAGLPPADFIITSKGIPNIITLLAWFPLILLSFLFLFQLVKMKTKQSAIKKEIAFFTGLFLLVILLPKIIPFLPVWVIPNKWSDFSHWGRVWETAKTITINWLQIIPTYKDVMAKIILYRHFIVCFICSFILLKLYKNKILLQIKNL